MGVIYKITCKTSGKAYIGQTKHTSRYRWNQHVWEANHPEANQSRHLNNAILKYGRDDFIIEDLHTAESHELDDLERHYIALHGTFGGGYNLNSGGKNIQETSEETRAILSMKLKGKPKNVKDNRKRPEDNELPKYMKCYKDRTGREGYKISDHPKSTKSRCFTSMKLTMKEKYDLALAVLNELNLEDKKLEEEIIEELKPEELTPEELSLEEVDDEDLSFEEFDAEDLSFEDLDTN